MSDIFDCFFQTISVFLFAIIFIILPIVVVVVPFATWHPESRGQLVGKIINIKRMKILYSTNEIEVIKGGLTNGDGSFGTKYALTIPDNNPNLLVKTREAFEHNKEVIIDYKTTHYCWLSSNNSNCAFVRNVIIK